MAAAQPLLATIDARPAAMSFRPDTSAVVVVDMQHDFASPEGMFGIAGFPLDVIASVVEPTQRVLSTARAHGIEVIYLAMQFDRELSNIGSFPPAARDRHLSWGVGNPVAAPDGTTGRVLVEDTWNTRIIDALAPEPGELVVPKHRFSGFFETNLDDLLRARGMETLFFTGCTTSVCVESTLRDAFFRGYRCVLLRDCCSEIVGNDESRTNHDATLTVVEGNFGWSADSVGFITALS
jgi:ureidoacrylate peracid hydrolase